MDRETGQLLRGLCAGILLAMSLLAGSRARAQIGPISPGDVSTPTPTLHPAFVPTSTPAPPEYGEEQALAYRVQAGDTLLTVALEMGVDVDDSSCLVTSHFTRQMPLVIGNLLTLPQPGTICHEIEAGETVDAVARLYDTTPALIEGEAWNAAALAARTGGRLPVGWHLRVPARAVDPATAVAEAKQQLPFMLHQSLNVDPALAVSSAVERRTAVGGVSPPAYFAPIPADWPYGTGNFVWPLFGWMTQDFHPSHRAIDIAAPEGTLVTAADRGVVLRAGWNGQGYGRFVIVDHNIDYITLYAHLSEVLVSEGEVVAQGEILGRVGSTGNSTGPHLHFEIRDFGTRVDPVSLLVHN